MRIVHISDCFEPRVGGIETQVGDLAAHQVADGHEVHVLTATAAESGQSARYDGVRANSAGVMVHRIATPLVAGLPVHPRGGSRIRRTLAEVKPDVVHVQAGVVSPFAFQGASEARRAGLPLAITWHCMLDGIERPLRWGGRVLGWDGESAALSAVSEVAAARVASAFPVEGAPGDVGVLPNGLDLSFWTPRPHIERTGALRLIATQRVAPRKRTRTLIQVMAALTSRLGAGAVELTIAGGGPDLAIVRREVERRGLSDVVNLRGRVPREELPALYAEHDAFISPARLEAFGIAALEARACGLPVVALAGTGIGTFIADEVDGLLADSDPGLAAAASRLVREDGLLARMTAHNRATPPAAGWRDVLAAAEREYARARRLLPF